MTTLIIRTKTGKAFVDAAERDGKLITEPGVNTGPVEKLAAAKIKKNKSR
jgi:coenzyme F420-reducing hydrogenase beta subunit